MTKMMYRQLERISFTVGIGWMPSCWQSDGCTVRATVVFTHIHHSCVSLQMDAEHRGRKDKQVES